MKIECQKSKIHGLGVFTTGKIVSGEVLEVCPVIILHAEETSEIDKTCLYDYYFRWGEHGSAIALGYGSLYNHSYEPNAEYIKDYVTSQIVIRSIKPIEAHREITLNYNGNPNNKEKVWFM